MTAERLRHPCAQSSTGCGFSSHVAALVRLTSGAPHVSDVTSIDSFSSDLADFRLRTHGHLVQISSLAGIAPPAPGLGAYAATKFAVEGISEALWRRSDPAENDVQSRDELFPVVVVSEVCGRLDGGGLGVVGRPIGR